jgi:dTMP kinase
MDMLPATEALLYSAARAQHVGEVVGPALSAGKVVICDRFLDSTYAYQGGGRGLELDKLFAIQSLAVGDTIPQVRFLLDLPVEEGLARRRAIASQVNRMDEADLEFHQRVRETYLALAGSAPGDWVVLDATYEIERLESLIATALRERLGIDVTTPLQPLTNASELGVHGVRIP